MYVKGLLFLILILSVGCSSQSSDESDSNGSTQPATLTIAPASYDYNYVPNGTRADHTFIITNNGGFNASSFSHVGSSGPFRFKGLDYPGTGGNCTPIIPDNTSCSVVIEFAPNTLDDFDETMQIQYLDGASLQILPVSLQGHSVIPAIAPTSLVLQNPTTTPNTDNTPTIAVSGGDVGPTQTVTLYTDAACTNLVATGTATGTTINLTSSTLSDGTYNFYAITTNSFGGVSPCSTATVNYEVDTTAPNPQTLITHSATHDNISTSPLISWALSTSTDVASQSIGISTNPAGGNDVAGWVNLTNSETSRTLTGLALNECTDYYATLFATDDVGLTSVYAVSATSFQVDANNPTDPSGLSLSGTPTLIKTPTLTFTPSTDACGIANYEIALGTSNSGAGVNDIQDWLVVGTPAGSYTLESGIDGAAFNLTPGGTYFVSIRSRDTFGNLSNTVTSASFVANPTFTLSQTDVFQDKIDLSWTAPITAGITDYDIYYKLTADSSFTLFADGVSTARTTTLTGLTPGNTYDIYVIAKITSTNIEFTNTLTETMDAPLLPPTSLVLLNPSSSPGNDTSPEITVSGGSTLSGNTVKIFSDNTCSAEVGTAVASGTSVNITLAPDLVSETTYTFYANVTDPDSYVSPCSTANVVYELDLTNPEPPTAITHAVTHNDTVTSPSISWTLSTSTDVANQYIGLSVNPAGGNDIAGWETINNSDTNYSFNSLSLNECTDYYPSMYVEDNAGNVSVYAVSTTPFQVDANNPSDPSGLSLSGTPTLIKAPTLTFTPSSDSCGIAGYELAVGTSNSGAGVNDTLNWLDVGSPAGNYTLESGIDGASFNLNPGGTYYVSIRSKDTFGNFSNIVTSTAFTVNPTFTLSQTNVYQDKIDLSWTAPLTSGITDYEIYYKLAADSSYALFGDGVSTATTTTLTGLSPANTYDIYIMTKVATTYVEYSNTLTETTDAPLLPPTSLILQNPATSPNSDASPEITVSGGSTLSGNTIKLFSDNTCSTEVGSAVATGSSVNITVSPDLTTETSYTFYANVTDPDAYVSVCSTANVVYEYDATNPDPPTSITHAALHTSTTTSPAISWTLSTSTDIANQYIGLSTNAAGGNDISGWESLNNTDTSYSFSGLSLSECTDIYPSLYVEDNAGNESIYAISTTPFQVDANNPTDPSGISLSGTPTLVKTPTLNFTPSSDACGVASYEVALGTSNSGAGVNDTQDWLDVGTPAGNYTLENGIDGAIINLNPGGTYYMSIRSKDSYGNYSNIVTSSSFIVSPTFTLSVVTPYPDQLDLSWTTPITAGITDYEIYYKLSADSSYTLVADGVSTLTTTTLTGLTPSSSYDIYIMAKVGTTYIEYSNTLTQVTDTPVSPPTSLVLLDPLTSPNNDPSPEITVSGGDVANGNTVKIFSDNTCSTEVGSAVATGTSVDITLSPDLSTDAIYTFYANVTDTSSYVSTCSTANVTYELDTLNPNPPTGITHPVQHTATTTSPLISWTLSTSTDIANQYIGLSANAIGGDDIAAFVTLSNSVTSYTFTGLTLNECINHYATVYAEDTSGNVSTYGVSTTPFVVDANAPTAITGTSLTGTSTFVQTPTFNWSGDATDACGIDYYEVALGTSNSGAGVNNTVDWINVGTPAGNYTLQDGVDGASFFLVPGTSYYISVRAIDVNGNEGVVATSNAFVPDSTFILGLDERLTTSLKMSWTAPITGGITDYDIFYKLSTDSTYSQFADGVSTDRNVEITGLTAGTEYDVFIKAKVGANVVEASNIITESTGPNIPFFTANYAAANVGGATGCRVIAFDGGGTLIKRNGSNLTTLTNAGDTFDFTCAQHDLLESDKPFYVNGQRAGTNISWASKGFSGKEYVFDFSRSSPQRLHLFAFETSNINIYRGTTLITSTTLAANSGTTTPITITTYGSYKVISDGLIIAFKDGNTTADPMLLSPVNQEIIGFPSNSARFGVYGTGVNVTASYGTGTPTTSTYNEGTSYSFGSTGSLYSGSALKLTATIGNKIGANSYADSNGYCSASFASTSKFFKRYILPGNSEYAAVAATEAMTIEIVNAATGAVESTFTLDGSAANGVYYKRVTNTVAGRIFQAVDPTKKFAMWWEPKSTTSYMENDDESIMWGSDD